MNAILQWIDERTGASAAWQGLTAQRVPHRACPLYALPAAILFTFLVQAVTGVVVFMYYTPTDQSAWESVYYLSHEVSGGWLLRSLHHNAAQLLLVLVLLYGVQMLVTRAYRAPRELVFWVVVLMGMLCLGLLLTGDLLSWDRNSYSATHVRVSFLKLLPVVGSYLFKIAVGGPGPDFGHLTLPRFLALHICVFSASFFGLIVLMWWFNRRADAQQTESAESATPFWPNQAAVNAVVCLVVGLFILGLSLSAGPEGAHLGSPADPDPAAKFAAARPEWAFLGLYEFAHLFGEWFPNAWGGVPIFVLPGLVALALLAMPLIGRSQGGHYFNLALAAFLLLGLTGLSFNTLARDAANEDHQAAIAEEHMLASRVVELAKGRGGLPQEGALWLLKNDAKIQGPKLFEQHCASCHPHVDAQGNGIACEEPSAPNLYGFATRDWVAGWLNEDSITGPDYFGNTAFAKGTMVGHVKDNMTDLSDEELEEVRQIALVLSAEAALPAQAASDKKDAKAIEEGIEMLDLYGCFDCHKFGDEGASLGDAPDLTGYGSREWTAAIIANPAHKRFYGDENDRMPAYAEFPDEPEKNLLSTREIELIADWLRGDWYEPAE